MSIISKTKFLSGLIRSYPAFLKRCLWFKKEVKENPFLILRAKTEDHCCLVQLLWEHYYSDEPTIAALGLGCQYNPVFDEQALKQLSEGLTLVAKCRYTGDIVGACINTTSCPWDPDLTDKLACSFTCERLRQLYQFYAYVQRAPCLWERHCTNKIFEMTTLFVRRQDRQRGIGMVLMDASKKLGVDCNYQVIRTDATSKYTENICKKLKMKVVLDIPYCSYTGKGPCYEPVFKTRPPHNSCKVFIDVPFYQYQ